MKKILSFAKSSFCYCIERFPLQLSLNRACICELSLQVKFDSSVSVRLPKCVHLSLEYQLRQLKSKLQTH